MRRLLFAITLSLFSGAVYNASPAFSQEPTLDAPAGQETPREDQQAGEGQLDAPRNPDRAELPAPEVRERFIPGPKLDLPQPLHEPNVVRERPLTNLDLPVYGTPTHDSAHQPQYPRPYGASIPAPPRRNAEALEAIQRKAELKAAQRQRRMATQKWFGYSNSRPSASSAPFMGIYSPTWSGNTGSPYLWNGSTYWPSSIHYYESSVRR